MRLTALGSSLTLRAQKLHHSSNNSARIVIVALSVVPWTLCVVSVIHKTKPGERWDDGRSHVRSRWGEWGRVGRPVGEIGRLLLLAVHLPPSALLPPLLPPLQA